MNKDIRLTGAEVVPIDGAVTECINHLMLHRDKRVVVSDRVRCELKD